MTRHRAPTFFTSDRITKLYESLLGRDHVHYKLIRSQIKAIYQDEQRKTPFPIAWAKAIAILRAKYGFSIPIDPKFETKQQKEAREQARVDYFHQKRIDEAKAEAQRAAINEWMG